MSDFQYNAIQQLAKVIAPAQGGYGTTSTASSASLSALSGQVTLTVIAVRDNQVLLKEQTSGQQLSVEHSSIQGFINKQDYPLKAGDRLILLSRRNNDYIFNVETPNAQSLPKPNLKEAHLLSAQWPQISPALFKALNTQVLASAKFPINSGGAANLISAIVDIANQSGQPILNAEIRAKVSSINANSVVFAFAGTSGQQINLTVSLSPELRTQLKPGQSVVFSLDGNNLKQPVLAAKLAGEQVLSKLSLQLVNEALRTKSGLIKQLVAGSLINPQQGSSNANLQAGIFIRPSHDNLKTLGRVFVDGLSSQLSPEVLNDPDLTRIKVTQNKYKLTQINAQVIAQPALLKIASSALGKLEVTSPKEQQSQLQATKVNIKGSAVADNPNPSPVQMEQNKVDKLSKPLLVSDALKTEILKNFGMPENADVKRLLTKTDTNSQAATAQTASNPVISEKTVTDNKVVSKTEASLSKLLSDTSKLMNQFLSHSEAKQSHMNNLFSTINMLTSKAGPELSSLLNQINVSQLGSFAAETSKQANVEGFNSEQLKQLFETKALLEVSPLLSNTSSDSFSNVNSQPRSSNSMINGLITLLQMSLNAKLAMQQPILESKIHLAFSQLAPLVAGKKNANSPKAMQDLQRLDPKGKLIEDIAKVLNRHSLNKLASVDATIQNQDSFHYLIPNFISNQSQDIELLINRDKHAGSENKQDALGTVWRLSMRLDVGSKGKVLAKIKLGDRPDHQTNKLPRRLVMAV